MQTNYTYFSIRIEIFQLILLTSYLAEASLVKALRVLFKAATILLSIFNREENSGQPANTTGLYIIRLIPLVTVITIRY